MWAIVMYIEDLLVLGNTGLMTSQFTFQIDDDDSIFLFETLHDHSYAKTPEWLPASFDLPGKLYL